MGKEQANSYNKERERRERERKRKERKRYSRLRYALQVSLIVINTSVYVRSAGKLTGIVRL